MRGLIPAEHGRGHVHPARFNPASIKSVALCLKGDSELEPLLTTYPQVEVVVMAEMERTTAESAADHGEGVQDTTVA